MPSTHDIGSGETPLFQVSLYRLATQQWCVKSASRRIMGIGTPSKYNSPERMVILLKNLFPLREFDVIAMPSADGSGITCTKRTKQERNEEPQ
jgi:hypothetical protein